MLNFSFQWKMGGKKHRAHETLFRTHAYPQEGMAINPQKQPLL